MKNKLIKSFKNTGICQINIGAVIEKFLDNIYVYKWVNDFTKKNEYTLSGRKLKVRISNSDAKLIIHRLGLREIKSAIFNSGSTYK